MATKEEKSLARFGDTLPLSRRRLEWKPPRGLYINTEKLMMEMWEDENRPALWLNFGAVPLDAILRTDENGKHIPGPIAERDRQVVAATVQWLATNCGRSFYERFQQKLAEESSKQLHTKKRNPLKAKC